MDSSEKNQLSLFTVALSYTLGLTSLLLVPVDVFILSEQHKTIESIVFSKEQMKNICLMLNCLMLIIAFFWIPLVYFFNESKEDLSDIDHDEMPLVKRVINAIKKTVFFLALVMSFLIIGYFLTPNYDNIEKENEFWKKSVFDISSAGEHAISFCLSILISIGLLLWIFNGSYGLATIPVLLIKGKNSLLETKTELRNDLAHIRQQYRSIQEKYSGSHTKITKEDQKMLSYLKKKELSLAVRNVQIDIENDATGFIPKLLSIIKPFSRTVGIICLIISVLFFAAMVITSLDRLINSDCGFSCGFLIQKEHFLNPLDWLLVNLSDFFPADYIIFFIIVSFLFVSSFYGNIKVGTRLIFEKKYEVRKDATLPHILLINGFLICIMSLALYSQLMTLSPQYTAFGNQRFKIPGSENFERCSLEKVSDNSIECHLSNTSSFFHKISLSTPLLSFLIYVGNFIFLFFYIVFLMKSLKGKSGKSYENYEQDTDEERETSKLLI